MRIRLLAREMGLERVWGCEHVELPAFLLRTLDDLARRCDCVIIRGWESGVSNGAIEA